MANSYRSTYKSHSESSLTVLTTNSMRLLTSIAHKAIYSTLMSHALNGKSTTGLHTYKYKRTYIMHPINTHSANVLFTLNREGLTMHDLCMRCLHYGSQKHLTFRTLKLFVVASIARNSSIV